jgi:hypothetical protein
MSALGALGYMMGISWVTAFVIWIVMGVTPPELDNRISAIETQVAPTAEAQP